MKKKKSLKGMTLIEIIIALAIFAMLGVILVQVGTLIDRTNKATGRLNRKVNAQSPYAASQTFEYPDVDEDGNPVTSELAPEAMNITVSIDEGGVPKTVNVKVKKSDGSEEYETKSVVAQATIGAKKYDTKAIVEDNPMIYDPDGPNRNHNLKFAILDDEMLLEALTFDLSVDASSKKIETAYGFALPTMEKWESTDPSVALVNSDGVVTPIAEGSCQIIGEKDGLRYVTNVIVVAS